MFRFTLAAVIGIAAIGVIGDHRTPDKDKVQVTGAVDLQLADEIPGAVRRYLLRPAAFLIVGDEYRLTAASPVENARKGNTVRILLCDRRCEGQFDPIGHIGGHAMVNRHGKLELVLVRNGCGAVGCAAGRQPPENFKVDPVQEVTVGVSLQG